MTSNDGSCGTAQGPAFAPAEIRDGVIVADQVKAAGPGWLNTQTRIDSALRSSADPFDHAVADLVNAGHMRTPAGRLDALVQAAAASSDSRVYSLAFRACYAAAHVSPIFKEPAPPASCGLLTARHWASLDPNNGVPWLAVLAQVGEDEDLPGQQYALAHLATATRFDEHQWQAAAAVLAQEPAQGANELATYDLAMNAWSSLAHVGLGPLTALCQNHAGGDAALAARCAAIATTMVDRSDSWGLRFTGASLSVYLGGDETRRKAIGAERAALVARERNEMPTSNCGLLRFQMQQMLRNGQIGEVAAARERRAGP